MEFIDREKLYSDSIYRFGYVSSFLDFGVTDIKAIVSVAENVRPLIPVVVDAVYAKLAKYDVTWKHFLPKNEGFEGKLAGSLDGLSLEHDQIKFRKDFLSKYLNRLLQGPYDEKLLKNLDWVAKIHMDRPEKKSRINVDYIHVNALMGYIETTLIGCILSLNLERPTELAALAAFNKLLWIQNDYFAKYYLTAPPSSSSPTPKERGFLARNIAKRLSKMFQRR